MINQKDVHSNYTGSYILIRIGFRPKPIPAYPIPLLEYMYKFWFFFVLGRQSRTYPPRTYTPPPQPTRKHQPHKPPLGGILPPQPNP